MSSQRYSSLTEVLLSAWREGRHVSDWSQVSPLPQTRAQGYEVQAAFGEAFRIAGGSLGTGPSGEV